MSDYFGQAEALKSLEAELGVYMKLDGIDYPCIIGDRTDTQEAGLGGYAPDAAVEVVLRRDLFTEATLPALDDLILLNLKQHAIKSIVLSPDGSSVVLACYDPNKDS